jgi:hypothetical protein
MSKHEIRLLTLLIEARPSTEIIRSVGLSSRRKRMIMINKSANHSAVKKSGSDPISPCLQDVSPNYGLPRRREPTLRWDGLAAISSAGRLRQQIELSYSSKEFRCNITGEHALECCISVSRQCCRWCKRLPRGRRAIFQPMNGNSSNPPSLASRSLLFGFPAPIPVWPRR